MIFRGGTILTMDAARPRVEEVVVEGGRVGEGPGRGEVIDLGGGTLVPGLVDGHAHLYGLGRSLEGVSLRGVRSEAEAAARVASSSEEWIVGRGWDQNLWAPAAWPTRASLDELVGTRPVVLRRIDGTRCG